VVSLETVGVDVKKNVIVTITSDKGLCGGINSTSVKVSKALYKLTSGNSTASFFPPLYVGSGISMSCIGRDDCSENFIKHIEA
jgi:F0F1-type ATP synthase gamma subunit